MQNSIQIYAEQVTISPNSYRIISVTIDGCDVGDLLQHLSVAECVNHYGFEEFLNEIGEDAVKKHFNLVDPE